MTFEICMIRRVVMFLTITVALCTQDVVAVTTCDDDDDASQNDVFSDVCYTMSYNA